ncbi:MAG TPA: hypothetical protein VH702_05300 [Vicinamibacterales bacterium]|jgi:hypothetical protein
MTPVSWMIGVSLVAWLVAAVFVGRDNALAVFVGMIGPLVATVISWVLSDRTYRRNPLRLRGVMILAFMAKIVFFGLYVAIVLRVLGQPLVPFLMSFTMYFVGLHFAQALLLRRLFASGMSPAR